MDYRHKLFRVGQFSTPILGQFSMPIDSPFHEAAFSGLGELRHKPKNHA
jgi:hypothetical protein